MNKTLYISVMLLLVLLTDCTSRPSTGKITGVIATGAKLKKHAGGFTWAEGPVEDTEGNLFFTDNRENLIYKLSQDGKVSIFLNEAKRANGLYLDNDGKIIACTGAPPQLVSMDRHGDMTVLADSYDNKPLNSPNDLWLDPKGGIYFTDPYWGKEKGLDRILYLPPGRNKKLVLATSNMVKPNGIIGTPDSKLLYVSDWNEKKTYVFTVNEDGTLSNKRLFAPEGDDGLAMDTEGNVYLTGESVTVYNSAGIKIETIKVPETAANVCFGGRDRKTLFITARTSVYSIRMRVKGL